MVIKDTTKIIKATPLYPDIMSEDAERLLIQKFNELNSYRNKVSSTHILLIEMKKQLEKLQEEYNAQASLFDIEYGIKEVNEIKNVSNLVVVNPDDYRNHD